MNKSSLTEGSVFKTLFSFSLPIIITNTITVLFHAADVAVLSLFVDGPAVAAVGACGSLITLMVALFTGLATGANVLISKRIGAADELGTKKSVGTSLVIGLLSGVILMIISLLFARTFLVLMSCQPEVLDMATLYMKIYFLGAPITMLNTFAIAILRSSGDSVRPMIYSIVSGFVNIFANIFFVTVCNMTVEGVAIATVFSSALSMALTLIRLISSKGICKIDYAHLRIYKAELIEIVRVGIPTCLSSLSFFVANVVLTSAVNSMGTDAMTANAISSQFDSIIYTVGAAIATGASVMVAQNFGAAQLERIKKTVLIGIAYVTAVSIFLGVSFVLFAEPLLKLLTDSTSVIAIAKDRMTLLCLTYFITSVMEVFSFCLRAIKRQKSTIVVGVICGFCIRAVWRWLAWPLNPTLAMLYACYAISAGIAIAIYFFIYKNALRTLSAEFDEKLTTSHLCESNT